jgi:hypothetical protein
MKFRLPNEPTNQLLSVRHARTHARSFGSSISISRVDAASEDR